MGRRPNALVSEYFARGAKCSDTSNRYSHTCKRCGEIFPKGRVDSLMSHLLRRCSSTSQAERVLIYRAIQQHNPTLPVPDNAPSRQHRHPQQQSALDTLAEVSRQQLDIPSLASPRQQNPDDLKTPASGKQDAEAQFYAHLREAVKAAPDALVVENAPRATEQFDTTAVASSPAPVPLIQAAFAANEHLEQTMSRQENLDPALESYKEPVRASPRVQDAVENVPPNAEEGTENSSVDDSRGQMLWGPACGPFEPQPSSHSLQKVLATSKQPMSFLPKIAPAVAHTFKHNLSDVMAASKQPMAGFGSLRNSGKARSKFSDNRRKQVQEVRKRGACIRCRMLKKPCSEGTPCNACKAVGSARLWKGSCMRTRLADEFTLWSAGLFNTQAKNAVADAFQGLEAPSTETSIEVRLLSNSDMCMTLAANRYNQNNLARQRTAMNAYSGTDPDLVLRAQFDAHTTSPPVYLLEEEAGWLSQLEEYVNRNVDACIENESSCFLKATLQRARALVKDEENEAAAAPSAGIGRACYTFQNQLIRNVVELWVETSILTQKRNDSDADVHIRLPSQQTGDAPQNLPPENVLLIRCQIYAALESRCTTLSKSIMNELERRLLQRQQVSRFATFLSAVILLSCIERVTGHFQEHDRSERWLLETPSSDLWPQGSHFADMLIMLLRMRGLPPKTMADDHGRLVVVEPALSASTSATKQSEGEAAETAASWLNPLEMQFQDLVRLRDGEEPDEGKTWDLSFIARALLPDIRQGNEADFVRAVRSRVIPRQRQSL